jgi:hypothetical protein
MIEIVPYEKRKSLPVFLFLLFFLLLIFLLLLLPLPLLPLLPPPPPPPPPSPFPSSSSLLPPSFFFFFFFKTKKSFSLTLSGAQCLACFIFWQHHPAFILPTPCEIHTQIHVTLST